MEAALKLDSYYTYADYCTWDNGERWELINGEAYAMAPSPTEGHQSLLLKIARQLGDFLDGKPCRVYVAPFDVRLNPDGADDTVVQPDILVVCDKSKLEGGKGVTGAPDFVVEILSPSSLRHDLITKFRLYQRSGVREYWIVDPESKTVMTHVFHESGAKFVSAAYDETDHAAPIEVLEGCTINLTEVFDGL